MTKRQIAKEVFIWTVTLFLALVCLRSGLMKMPGVPRVAGYGAGIFAIVMFGAVFTHATHKEMSRLPFNFLLLALSLIIAFARQPNIIKKLRKAG